MMWTLIGIDFHRWRGGATWGDRFGGDNYISHHGFYSLEWARGGYVKYYAALRHSFWRRAAPSAAGQREGGA